MNPVQQKFVDRWPDWFSYGKIRCGFYLPNGWEQLVWTLCEVLERIDPGLQVDQIKEKFGGLRFYVTTNERQAITPVIELAERLSQKTCQQCGAPATTQTHGNWMVTLCTPCRSQCRP